MKSYYVSSNDNNNEDHVPFVSIFHGTSPTRWCRMMAKRHPGGFVSVCIGLYKSYILWVVYWPVQVLFRFVYYKNLETDYSKTMRGGTFLWFPVSWYIPETVKTRLRGPEPSPRQDLLRKSLFGMFV